MITFIMVEWMKLRGLLAFRVLVAVAFLVPLFIATILGSAQTEGASPTAIGWAFAIRIFFLAAPVAFVLPAGLCLIVSVSSEQRDNTLQHAWVSAGAPAQVMFFRFVLCYIIFFMLFALACAMSLVLLNERLRSQGALPVSPPDVRYVMQCVLAVGWLYMPSVLAVYLCLLLYKKWLVSVFLLAGLYVLGFFDLPAWLFVSGAFRTLGVLDTLFNGLAGFSWGDVQFAYFVNTITLVPMFVALHRISKSPSLWA